MRQPTKGLAAAMALTALIIGAPVTAHASNTSDSVISWSVVPADESGPDGRRWLDIDVEPGETLTEHLAVTNHSDVPVTFGLAAADARFTKAGRFDMLPASERSVAAGTWIDIAPTVTVAPGATVVVPYAITVPGNATPGDNAAGVAASFLSSGSSPDGTQVGVESRVGFRVMMRVAGALAPSIALTDVTASHNLSWNPFRPGTVDVRYTVTNTGNVRLVVDSLVDSSGRLFAAPSAAAALEEILPGDSRTVDATVAQVWPLGLLRIVVDSTAAETIDGPRLDDTRVELWVWALPWPQLLVLIGVLLLIAGLFWRRRHQQIRLGRLLDAARREGARQTEDAASVDEPVRR